MYECPCKTIESLDLIKRTSFDKNEFMTCYLIFNFRPTFFSYFWKITADSVFHNVKKQVGQKWPFPVVKGLNDDFLFSVIQIGAPSHGQTIQGRNPNSFASCRKRLKLCLGRGFDHFR